MESEAEGSAGLEVALPLEKVALELVAEGCPADYLLNDDRVRYYLESSINQPAIKIVMVFDEAWWTDPKVCKHRPELEWPSAGPPPPAALTGLNIWLDPHAPVVMTKSA